MPTVIKFEFQGVGEQLLLAMKRLGLTQYELAKRSGISRRQIGMAFKGANITLDTLSKIAKVLRIQHVRVRDMDLSLASPVNSEVLTRASEVLDSISDQAEQVKVLLGQDAGRPSERTLPQAGMPRAGEGGRTADFELMQRAYELVKAIAGASQKASNQ